MNRDTPLILIVDDNDAGRYATSRTVRAAGFSVLEATSGRETLEKASLNPDLIILDIHLPDIDGYEVSRLLRENPATASIPVLHLTAMFLRIQDKVHGLEGGADGYLSQPVDPAELVATIRSLLRIRQAERERKEEARRWHATFNGIEDAICVLDGEGIITRFNASFQLLAGSGSEELLARKYDEIFPGAADAILSRPVARAIENRMRENFELEFRGRWFFVTVDPVFDERSAATSFVHIMRDITERKRMENELHAAMENARVLQKEAEAASRAKSSFLATMSHEIRTPLNGVLGFLSLLADTPLDDEQREYIGYIDSSSRLLLDVISNVLDISSIESERFYLAPSRTDLPKMLERAIALVSPGAAEKSLPLRLCIEKDVPRYAVLDSTRVVQVLGNLLSNALKFTEKGAIDVSLSFAPREDGKGDFLFSVMDTGIGISEEEKQRIFEPFYQTDGSNTRRYGGSGLGLSIARALLKKMGGSMQVESVPGEGSRFFFTLRADYDYGGEAGETVFGAAGGIILPQAFEEFAGKIEEPRSGAPLILLVEDAPLNRLMLRLLVSRIVPDAAIKEAEDGEEGVRLFARCAPNLVFMDLHMPVKDGVSAAREIREMEKDSGRRTPIVALTADVRPETKKTCCALGIDGYLSKPVQKEELEQMLGRFFGGMKARR